MELKIRKFGGSLGVVLPKNVIQLLHTAEGEFVLLINTGDGDYWLMPYDHAFGKRMMKAEGIMARYRNTLHALAKRKPRSSLDEAGYASWLLSNAKLKKRRQTQSSYNLLKTL